MKQSMCKELQVKEFLCIFNAIGTELVKGRDEIAEKMRLVKIDKVIC